jgi:hypothetical protein
MSLKLYWHGGDTSEINFGDTISPLIVEAVSGRPVRFADLYTCDMIAIGSILDKTIRRQWKRLARLNWRRTVVWGSGSLSPEVVSKHFHLNPLAVRGPKTRDAMSLDRDIPLGDPGLFVNRLCGTPQKKWRWGIIPHVTDRTLDATLEMAKQTPGATLIDLGDPDIIGTLNKIAACDFIASSSLHGLVTADALGIPNTWLKLSENINGGNWKFHDYMLSVGRPAEEPHGAVSNLQAYETIAACADLKIVEARRNGLEQALKKAGIAA